MNPVTSPIARLKLGAIAFVLLWTGWMIWWSGIYDAANVVILTVCGCGAGYLWYRAMRRQFERMRRSPPDRSPPDSVAK